MQGTLLDVDYTNIDLSGSTDIDIVSPKVNIDASTDVTISGTTEVQIDSALVDINGTTTTMDGDTLTVNYKNIDLNGTTDIDIKTPIFNLTGTTTNMQGDTLNVDYDNISITGTTTFKGQVTIDNTLTVNELATFNKGIIIPDGYTFEGELDKTLTFISGDKADTKKFEFDNTSDVTVPYVNNGGDTINGTLKIGAGITLNTDGTSSFGGNMSVTGTITASSAIYSSDKNLKENIKNINKYDIATVADVDLKSYKFIDDETHRERYGVIAQDLESVGLEHLVVKGENGKKGVDYISILILKIAQLEKEIEELKKKK